MGRLRSRAEVWVPAGYLAVVVGLVVWVGGLAWTGEAGLAAVWPILATAPLSLLVLPLLVPAPDAGGAPEAVPVHTGPNPPPEPPTYDATAPEPLPTGLPVPDADAYDPAGAELLDLGAVFGLAGVLLACALVNAVAIWALVRGLTGAFAGRRHHAGRV
ncbi:SCO4225 family membrane protein [Streptomyces sp. CC210A]|uniref:SCO4225 family membrane protein n=1 Tax=Streptomyces sp. CC210A TaxID=2898184 RepID=UPI001F1CBBE6|nr:hypothetical protein [Streptomyces sp. CC210A]